MSYSVLPLYSSQLFNFGNMKEASTSTTIPHEHAEKIIQADHKVNDVRVEQEIYNYYQQPDHRDIGVPLQCPLMNDYQTTDIRNNHGPIFQQPLYPRMEISDWRCQQVVGNPKKRLKNLVCGQNVVVNKKLAHEYRMQGTECRREKVPVRRSQKLADKITALQKLVSPYGKTDTASVLQEAHISINHLHDQIKKLLHDTQNSRFDGEACEFQVEKKAETGLQDKGLCLVSIPRPMFRNY